MSLFVAPGSAADRKAVDSFVGIRHEEVCEKHIEMSIVNGTICDLSVKVTTEAQLSDLPKDWAKAERQS